MLDAISTAWAVWDFLQSPAGAAIFAALFGLSEALAMIPWIRANNVYQAVANILKKLAPTKSVVPLVCLMLLAGLTACSKANIQANTAKIKTVAVKVRAGLKEVAVYGCAGAEVLLVAYPEVQGMLPPGSDTDEIERMVAVATPVMEQLCIKAQMQRNQGGR